MGVPAERWASATAPTLVLAGENSPAWMQTAARALTDILPHGQLRSLGGQDHAAVFTAPRALVPVLVEFLTD